MTRLTDKPDIDRDGETAAAAGNPLALARLADRIAGNDPARARALCAEALRLAPHEPEVATIAAELMSESVPAWHAAIVADRARNEAYDAALRDAVTPGARVLEVGTGSGLLAMMAARAGAAEVVTCEENPVVAERAREIIARNGYADRVRVIGKHSSEVRIGEDISGPADIFVSEIISGSLLNEAVLPVMEDVVPRLVRPGGIVIPYRASIRIALAWYAGAPNMRIGDVEGFDLSAFNGLLAPHYPLQIEDPLLTLASPAADLFAFGFSSGGPYPDGRNRIVVRAGSRANGVVQWIRIRTDEASHYENRPGSGEASSWSAEFHPFTDGGVVETGEEIAVAGSHGKTALRLWTAMAQPNRA
jgi:predicted O-methyltransferase YrrM